MSEGWRQQDSWWANGESFLFKLYPEFQTYKWHPDNTSLFVLTRPNNISIGGGGGVGLYLEKYASCNLFLLLLGARAHSLPFITIVGILSAELQRRVLPSTIRL